MKRSIVVRDHRNGAGHLERAYEERLRARVRREWTAPERAFVVAASGAHSGTARAGEEFVLAVTSGDESGATELDPIGSEEGGGPFVLTTGHTEFAYGSDASNPHDGTREPFPRT